MSALSVGAGLAGRRRAAFRPGGAGCEEGELPHPGLGERGAAAAGAPRPALEHAEDAGGAPHDIGGQAGQPGDVDAVGTVRAPRLQPVEEDDVPTGLPHRDVERGRARQRLREADEFVVVGGEHGARSEFVQPLGHRPRDREAVVRRRAPPDLVEEDERALGGAVQDGRGLRHLHHEGALPRGEVVARAHAREHAVAYPDQGPASRDEGTDVRHERDESRLAQDGGLPRHVRAGDDQGPALLVQPHVVRDEGVPRDGGLDDGVPALFDVEDDVVAEPRPHVVLGGGDLGEAGEEVDLGDEGGGRLNPPDLGGDVVPQGVEEVRLEPGDLIVGPEDLRLPLLEFRREISLGVGERLPAGPLLRHAVRASSA